MRANLVYDFGFHIGDDTDYYLKKGFQVVAIEANEDLVKLGNSRFKREVENGQLVLIHAALTDTDEEYVTFYIHPNNSDWSSCIQEYVEHDGTKSVIKKVKSTNIKTLYATYGVPRYIKIDIEGCDTEILKQISVEEEKPKFVSVETSRRTYAGLFAYLYLSGYTQFQLVNQLNHNKRTKNDSNYEGKKIDYTFGEFSSGSFGNDLSDDGWLTYDEALTRYVKYKELKGFEDLGLGWLDLHAKKEN